MNKAVITVIVVVLVFALGVYFLMGWSYGNKEVAVRNQTLAQQNVCKAHFDLMWKAIQQVAKVPDAAKDAFKEMYTPLISGRYSADSNGVIMKWITESNPSFDWTLYGNVQRVIEAQRTAFFNEQTSLIDLQREHTTLLQQVPGKWFLGDKDTIAIVIITSEKTEDAYQTGQENDIDLFK